MARAATLVRFERIAFEAELRARPGDRNAAAAYLDWLQDHDHTPLSAKRIVNKVIREATEEKQRERVERFLSLYGEGPMAARNAIYFRANLLALEATYIETVRGGQSPTTVGDVAYWRTPTGRRLSQAAHEAMPEVEVYYQPGNLRIVVGAAWVVQYCEDAGITIVLDVDAA